VPPQREFWRDRTSISIQPLGRARRKAPLRYRRRSVPARAPPHPPTTRTTGTHVRARIGAVDPTDDASVVDAAAPRYARDAARVWRPTSPHGSQRRHAAPPRHRRRVLRRSGRRREDRDARRARPARRRPTPAGSRRPLPAAARTSRRGAQPFRAARARTRRLAHAHVDARAAPSHDPHHPHASDR
jgi:hypothetical protein